MIDCGFPVIQYSADQSPRQWGRSHGEAWREAIAELVEIRTSLMREKNKALTDQLIETLAQQQWQATADYDGPLIDECDGIREGANISLTDLVILNNYTDFRDIQVPDQGCSVVLTNYAGVAVAGQTWDMHGSAKRFVSCIEVPVKGFDQPAVMFSLVGCLGMMGFHPAGHMIGVNNINTDGAKAGAIWPAVIRKTLNQSGLEAMENHLPSAPVTSGHSYLLAGQLAGENAGQFWEVMPGLAEKVSELSKGKEGFLFHTNHCVGPEAQKRESTISQNSTTHIRYSLIEKKIAAVRTFDDVYDLMNDHENYPKSICSNFQTDAQDPSVTCGGAVGDLNAGLVKMWRGDELHDDNFVCHEFKMKAAGAKEGANVA